MKKSQEWQAIFLRNFAAHQILRPDYLVPILDDGRIYCKACGCFVDGIQKKHFNMHVREFKIWERNQAQARAQARLEAREHARKERSLIQSVQLNEYYTNPCAKCGKKIKRTGKPGRAPKYCLDCRN